MCTGGAPGLDGLWQGIISGFTIVVIVAIAGGLRSKWRQREQIAFLRQIVQTAFGEMWADRNQRRNTYQYLLAVLETTLQHRTPNLACKRLGAIRKALAEAVVLSTTHGLMADRPMDAYEYSLFAKLEALDWLGLDLAAIRERGPADSR